MEKKRLVEGQMFGVKDHTHHFVLNNSALNILRIIA